MYETDKKRFKAYVTFVDRMMALRWPRLKITDIKANVVKLAKNSPLLYNGLLFWSYKTIFDKFLHKPII
jgi:hypothetical protein